MLFTNVRQYIDAHKNIASIKRSTTQYSLEVVAAAPFRGNKKVDTMFCGLKNAKVHVLS